MAQIKLGATANVTVSDEIGCSIKRGATGRRIDTLSKEQWKSEVLVEAWLSDDADNREHPGRALVSEGLEGMKLASPMVSYRALSFASDVAPASAIEFGPNPKRRSNRYNRDGETAMYLCTTVAGLQAEMLCYHDPEKVCFFATFSAISSEISIADLTDASLPAVVHQAFDYAERPESRWAGHRLADLIRSLGYQGLLVPGVRGSPANRYANLVIFNYEGWEAWVDSRSPPRLLFT